MVIVACGALNLFNPAFTFVEAMTGAGGLGSSRRAKKQAKLAGNVTSEEASGNASEVDGVAKREV